MTWYEKAQCEPPVLVKAELPIAGEPITEDEKKGIEDLKNASTFE